jgi:uncharacterized protein YegL
MSPHNHICGLYYLVPSTIVTWQRASERRYLPQVSLSVHAQIIASTSRTTLTQTFANPSADNAIPELRYTFPLYDGVSVVGFTCTINRDRVIKGVVKERAQARKTFEAAVARGETAGLFEQLPDASDVFTTTIGNVPAGAEIKVDITYLGELKHDAEADGTRFTIPTSIAPRYGSYPGEMLQASNVNISKGISIIVDAEVPDGSNIKSVQSPSHPISVTIGNTSAGAASGAEMSLQKASATLSLGTTELGEDFVLHVVATNTANPVAVLETHPTIPNHRALMATLVPKFNLPSSRPEIVFLCDRSGSMCSGNKIPNMKTALQVFLKSLPVGVKFNICSFGSHYELLFKKGSKSYDASSLKEASSYVDKFDSNFGGTEMYQPLEDIFKRRFKDMNLEVFLLTDGEIWDQQRLFTMINKHIDESKGAIRVFTLGIGSDVSHALIEGVARAGNGFSQSVGDNENMNSKVVRMLKASLTPHIRDYTLEVKYGKEAATTTDDDFEIVEKVMDAMALDVREPEPKSEPKKAISLFDASANPDAEMTDASLDKTADGKYSHVPPVSEPKLLQTPFIIPPLFPFNRTSVYLLMSPESSQKMPKSVVLRGTSAYGPLELEIPVTVLAEKRETIHQLAARQAVKELEEGRGWLYHAKDGNGPKAKLLKDNFEGRFSDMVEREAVRLGVRYQVGGKWCSFVAVDSEKKNAKVAAAGSTDIGSIAPPEYASSDEGEDCGFGLFDDGGPAPSTAHSYSVKSASQGTAMKRFSQRVLSPGMLARKSSSPPKPAAVERSRLASSSAFGGGGPSHDFVAPAAELCSAPPPPPAPSSAPGYRGAPNPQLISFMSSVPSPAPMAKRKGGAGSTALLDQARESLGGRNDKSKKESRGGGSFVNMFKKSTKNTASVDDWKPEEEDRSGSMSPLPTDALEAIVAQQSFEGSWAWNNGDLLAALGLDAAGLGAKLQQLGAIFAPGTSLAATAVVLAYLEAKLGSKKEEWEMLAEKAMDWLNGELRTNGATMSAAEMVEKVKGLVA